MLRFLNEVAPKRYDSCFACSMEGRFDALSAGYPFFSLRTGYRSQVTDCFVFLKSLCEPLNSQRTENMELLASRGNYGQNAKCNILTLKSPWTNQTSLTIVLSYTNIVWFKMFNQSAVSRGFAWPWQNSIKLLLLPLNCLHWKNFFFSFFLQFDCIYTGFSGAMYTVLSGSASRQSYMWRGEGWRKLNFFSKRRTWTGSWVLSTEQSNTAGIKQILYSWGTFFRNRLTCVCLLFLHMADILCPLALFLLSLGLEVHFCAIFNYLNLFQLK